MTDIFRKDPKFVRSSILYEFMRGKPIFETYKSFCEVMGEEAIEYREFECWYLKFARGNYDLTWDESLRPNNLLLLDLPIEIIEKIVKKTTWSGVIALRQVCQNLRNIVDDTKIVYQEVNIKMEKSKTTLSIDGDARVYKRIDYEDFDSDEVKKQKNSDYLAFHDLVLLMKHPRIHVENLFAYSTQQQISWGESFDRDLLILLASSEFHVRSVRFRSLHSMAYCILTSLKPGVLENIEFDVTGTHAYCDDMSDHDLWKMAKVLKITGFDCYMRKMACLINLVHFDIEIYSVQMSGVIYLKNTLLESSVFERGHLKWKTFINDSVDSDTDEEDDDEEEVLVLDRLEEILGPHTRKDSKDPNYRQYVIEHENKIFELKIGEKSIEIERKR